MNKLVLFLCVFIAFCTFASCNDDESDYSYQIANVKAEAREGAIMLRWDLPKDSIFYLSKSNISIFVSKKRLYAIKVFMQILFWWTGCWLGMGNTILS